MDGPDLVGPRSARDPAVDAAACVAAVALGALVVGGANPPLHEGWQLSVDVALGLLGCLALWWRRRWPLGVAVLTVALGTFSSSATIAGLLALSSLAVHRGGRSVLVVAALWVPASLAYVVYSPQDDTPGDVGWPVALTLAATAWGMYVRARRQLVLSLRERALRAEADQHLRADRARMAERTRIAREMHDVLAHKISLVALHAGALELRPDLPPATVRETAGLLRTTARQALEELRSVIGVLREEPAGGAAPAAPQPTLSDIPRLVEETRRAGTSVELQMQVDHPEAAPGGLGRDAYRIAQEALTNVGKHAHGTVARVLVTGAPGRGLYVSVRNRLPLHVPVGPGLPGAGAGLLGLQERVTLAGGSLVHGPGDSGDFVVEAELPW